MTSKFARKSLSACSAALLSAAVWAPLSPASAQVAPTQQRVAQATAPQATPQSSQSSPGGASPAQQPTKKAKASLMDRVETRIKSLHDRLHITAAQQPQWDAVAQAMRDNAQTVQADIQKRKENMSTMTAVDDLKSYQAIADAHAEGLKNLVPAFQALYDTMSDAQKKNADAVFGHRRTHPKQKSG